MTDLLSFSDALTARTADEVRLAILSSLSSKGVQATGWSSLAVQRALVEVDSEALSRQEQIRATLAAAGYLDTAAIAADQWLDLLAWGFFQLKRAPATRAVHMFRATNDGGVGPQTIAPRSLVKTTLGGVIFRSTTKTTLPAGVGQFVDFEVVADVAGSSGNIAVGTGLSWLGSGLPGVSLSNPAIGSTGSSTTAAGADPEGNPSLVARCRGRWGATSVGGNAGAFAVWIQEAFAAMGQTSTITRWKVDDGNPNGPGSLDVYLANAAGPASTPELAIVEPYILARQTLGVGPWRVRPCIGRTEIVTAQLFGSGNTDLLADAAAALIDLEVLTPIGGKLYRAAIVESLMGVSGMFNVVLSTPASDVQLAAQEVVIISPSGLTV